MRNQSVLESIDDKLICVIEITLKCVIVTVLFQKLTEKDTLYNAKIHTKDL